MWRKVAAGDVSDRAPSGPPSAERPAWTLGRAGCKTRRSEDTRVAQVESFKSCNFLSCTTSRGLKCSRPTRFST